MGKAEDGEVPGNAAIKLCKRPEGRFRWKTVNLAVEVKDGTDKNT